jgi:hypothetical protein
MTNLNTGRSTLRYCEGAGLPSSGPAATATEPTQRREPRPTAGQLTRREAYKHDDKGRG